MVIENWTGGSEGSWLLTLFKRISRLKFEVMFHTGKRYEPDDKTIVTYNVSVSVKKTTANDQLVNDFFEFLIENLYLSFATISSIENFLYRHYMEVEIKDGAENAMVKVLI